MNEINFNKRMEYGHTRPDFYCLYFQEEGGKLVNYGCGDMKYIVELLDDYLDTNKMYGKDITAFRICHKNNIKQDFYRDIDYKIKSKD